MERYLMKVLYNVHLRKGIDWKTLVIRLKGLWGICKRIEFGIYLIHKVQESHNPNISNVLKPSL